MNEQAKEEKRKNAICDATSSKTTTNDEPVPNPSPNSYSMPWTIQDINDNDPEIVNYRAQINNIQANI